MISSHDWALIEEIAGLLRAALRLEDAFLAGYVCHAAKAYIGEFEDQTIRARASELETAVYRVRTGRVE